MTLRSTLNPFSVHSTMNSFSKQRHGSTGQAIPSRINTKLGHSPNRDSRNQPGLHNKKMTVQTRLQIERFKQSLRKQVNNQRHANFREDVKKNWKFDIRNFQTACGHIKKADMEHVMLKDAEVKGQLRTMDRQVRNLVIDDEQ